MARVSLWVIGQHVASGSGADEGLSATDPLLAGHAHKGCLQTYPQSVTFSNVDRDVRSAHRSNQHSTGRWGGGGGSGGGGGKPERNLRVYVCVIVVVGGGGSVCVGGVAVGGGGVCVCQCVCVCVRARVRAYVCVCV